MPWTSPHHGGQWSPYGAVGIPGFPGGTYQPLAQPGQAPPGRGKARSAIATAALVVGVTAAGTLPLGFVTPVVGLLLFLPFEFVSGVLAIVFGGVGLAGAKRTGAGRKGHALTGLVCGIFVVAVLLVLAVVGVVQSAGDDPDGYQDGVRARSASPGYVSLGKPSAPGDVDGPGLAHDA